MKHSLLLSILFFPLISFAGDGEKCFENTNKILQASSKEINLTYTRRLVLQLLDYHFGEEDFDHFLSHPSFQRKFNKERNSLKADGFVTLEDQILHFVFQGIEKFFSSDLDSLREKKLRQILFEHGYVGRKSGREALSEVGNKNVKRLLQRFSKISIDLPEEVVAKLDSLKILPIHHSAVGGVDDRLGIVSSFALENIMGFGGANTEFFNKTIVKTDDQIFFFPMMTFNDGEMLSKTNNSATPNQYGKFMVSVSDELINRHGIVSLFVMYPDDLIDPLVSLDHPAAIKILDIASGMRYRLTDDDMPEVREHFIEYDSEWAKMLEERIKFDMTPSQYEELVRNMLKKYLSLLKKEDHDEYRELSKQLLETPEQFLVNMDLHHKQTGTFFKKIYGISLNLEFTIPVAIGKEDLRFF